jgi:predicted enzyme related to lactoylglutathione lyase
MTSRDTAPAGAPCWVDLWTSDVDGSRRFYAELFGWEAQAPSAEFGGYFMFTRNGIPVAGAMGGMPGMPAQDVWKPYLATDDITKTLDAAERDGAHVVGSAMDVADLGRQGVIVDPTGATVGVWQPGTFQGFTVLDEHGAPSWFELFTRDHARALDFYRSVFRWDTDVVSDTDEFRYATVRNPAGAGEVAGVMDAGGFLREGVPAHWSVYWHVDDIDGTAAAAARLGGAVVMGPETTPYGRLATVADPAGAQFKLRTPA